MRDMGPEADDIRIALEDGDLAGESGVPPPELPDRVVALRDRSRSRYVLQTEEGDPISLPTGWDFEIAGGQIVFSNAGRQRIIRDVATGIIAGGGEFRIESESKRFRRSEDPIDIPTIAFETAAAVLEKEPEDDADSAVDEEAISEVVRSSAVGMGLSVTAAMNHISASAGDEGEIPPAIGASERGTDGPGRGTVRKLETDIIPDQELKIARLTRQALAGSSVSGEIVDADEAVTDEAEPEMIRRPMTVVDMLEALPAPPLTGFTLPPSSRLSPANPDYRAAFEAQRERLTGEPPTTETNFIITGIIFDLTPVGVENLTLSSTANVYLAAISSPRMVRELTLPEMMAGEQSFINTEQSLGTLFTYLNDIIILQTGRALSASQLLTALKRAFINLRGRIEALTRRTDAWNLCKQAVVINFPQQLIHYCVQFIPREGTSITAPRFRNLIRVGEGVNPLLSQSVDYRQFTSYAYAV